VCDTLFDSFVRLTEHGGVSTRTRELAFNRRAEALMVDDRDIGKSPSLRPANTVNLFRRGHHAQIIEHVRQLDVQDFFAMTRVNNH
jgi:hypothetical protein